MTNAPRANFEVLKDMIFNYHLTTPDSLLKGHDEVSPRAEKYVIESELIALDFLQDEMRALLNDIDNRGKFLSEKLDSGV